jgi:SMI1/KNR4 family protein SUKH-1
VLPTIAEILKQPDRNWSGNPPASEEDILRLIQSCKVKLPDEYLDLLRVSNGGEGDLALPPLLFVLFDIDEVLEMLKDSFYREEFPDLLFFGGNGGLEQIAFDLRKGEPYPIVMIDAIAGSESAVEIALNMAQFTEAIALERADES